MREAYNIQAEFTLKFLFGKQNLNNRSRFQKPVQNNIIQIIAEKRKKLFQKLTAITNRKNMQKMNSCNKNKNRCDKCTLFTTKMNSYRRIYKYPLS